jgi:cell division protein FtsI (penicillin-binding protein 3)
VRAVVHPDLMVKLPAWRARLMLGLLLVWLTVLCGRSLFLQSLHHDFLRQKGESRYSRVIELSATRGKIVDRHN